MQGSEWIFLNRIALHLIAAWEGYEGLVWITGRERFAVVAGHGREPGESPG